MKPELRVAAIGNVDSAKTTTMQALYLKTFSTTDGAMRGSIFLSILMKKQLGELQLLHNIIQKMKIV